MSRSTSASSDVATVTPVPHSASAEREGSRPRERRMHRVSPSASHVGYTGPARVAAGPAALAGSVQVFLPEEDQAVEATVALPGATRLTEATRVLVTRGSDGQLWVIGVLEPPEQRVQARNGVSASVVSRDDGEVVEVRDPEGGLLFQYDPTRGVTRVQISEGDLELLAPMGEVTIAAGGGLHLHGRSIQLRTLSSVRILVHDLASRILGSMGIGRRGLELQTPSVRVETDESNLTTKEVGVRADLVSLEAQRVRTRAGSVELEADSLVQRVGSLTRWVRDLAQLRAGRLRSIVTGSWISRSGRADLRSKETFKVDGDRIHLG